MVRGALVSRANIATLRASHILWMENWMEGESVISVITEADEVHHTFIMCETRLGSDLLLLIRIL